VPVYPPFLWAPRHTQRNLVRVPLARRGGRWTIDFDRLEASVTPRVRVFMLCNPHNPTGRVMSREELTRIAALCEKHNLLIASDEIHCGLVLDADKRHVPIATLAPEVAARTLTFMAPSKTFNVPGLCCAFAVIGSEALRKSFRQALFAMNVGENLMGLAAALAAYRHGGPWREALLEYLRGNRELVEREVGTIDGLSMCHVEATYLAWIDATSLGMETPGRFFEQHGVGFSEGRGFGGPGFVRLNFGCPRSVLAEGLARMRRAVESAS